MGSPFDSLPSPIAAVLPLLLLSSSCAPAGELLLTGKLPPSPAAPAATKGDEATKAPQPEGSAEASASAKTSAEKRQPTLPIDTRFTHGKWHLQRTSRALYAWTGTGDQLRLVAIELDIDEPCWFSRTGERPEAKHCADLDAPLASVKIVRNGRTVTNVFADGFEKAPWKTSGAESPLPEGKHTLPDAGGGAIGHLEAAEGAVIVRTGTERGQRVLTFPKTSDAYLVDGSVPDAFDGCASANGTVAVLEGVRVQVGKKTCEMRRTREGEKVTLSVAQATLAFSRREEAPNLAEQRAQAAKVRESSAGKAQLQLEITGDATHTVAAFAAKKSSEEGKSGVEVNATLQGAHYRCSASVERFDPAWVQTVKRMCSSMTK